MATNATGAGSLPVATAWRTLLPPFWQNEFEFMNENNSASKLTAPAQRFWLPQPCGPVRFPPSFLIASSTLWNM